MQVFFHPAQDRHSPKTYFTRGQMRTPQEVPDRTARMLAGFRALDLAVDAPADAGAEPISAVHDLAYLRFLQRAHQRWMEIPEDWGDEVMSNIFVREPNTLRGILAEAARYLADGSCPVGEHTWDAAYWSAQTAVAAADALLAGEKQTFALCRPPGHHARRDAAGGFCYLNNAAIAAQRLTSRYPRIAILDTDMHHGQGIQDIFWERSDVLYVSIHGDPTNFYPVVSGFEDECGAGEGLGYNINLPMPHGSSEADFFARLGEGLDALTLFQPDALVLALGFDIYQADPQAKVAVTTEGFARLGSEIAGLGLPTLVVQEGGYDLDSLSDNLQAFLQPLLRR